MATSPETERRAREVGLHIESFEGPESLARLDIAIDGADQVDSAGWVVKGGGAAHTREKRVAASTDRFAIIVDSGKLVDRIDCVEIVGLSADFRLQQLKLDVSQIASQIDELLQQTVLFLLGHHGRRSPCLLGKPDKLASQAVELALNLLADPLEFDEAITKTYS